MDTGFAANGISVKYSFACLQEEMVFHLHCLYSVLNRSVFSLLATFNFDTLALGRNRGI